MTTDSDGAIVIPRWAQWAGGGIAAILLTLAIPWAANLHGGVSELKTSLARIETQIAGQVRVTDVEVAGLRSELTRVREDLADVRDRLRSVEAVERRADKPPSPFPR